MTTDSTNIKWGIEYKSDHWETNFPHLHSKRNPISGGKRNRKEDGETEI